MRPIKLAVSAFGPFATEQQIDFTELGKRSFFLIEGPIGSGKTSILDAICYALYGESSGGERDGEDLRSHHAKPDRPTEVTFEFELGASGSSRTYRVTRRPAQSRPARRGGGMTDDQPTATLWEVPPAGAPVVLGKAAIREVSARITELIGVTADQFRQVIVLPQGKFRELLAAKSDDRKIVLERLFGTEIYRRIERALDDEFKRLHQELGSQIDRLGWILSQQGAQDEADLRRLTGEARVEATRLRDEATAAEAQAKVAGDALNLGNDTNEKLVERDKATHAFDLLAAEQPDRQYIRDTIANAHRAQGVMPVEAQVTTATTRRQEAASDLTAKQGACTAASAAYELQKTALANETARQAEREAASRRVQELEALAERVTALAQLHTTHEVARIADVKAKADRAIADANATATTQALADLKDEIANLRETAAGLTGVELLASDAKKRLDARTTLDKSLVALSEAMRSRDASVKAHEIALRLHEEARTDLDATSHAWTATQASRLAKSLTTGDACPVCGSTDHPIPAVAVDTAPTDADLEAAKKRLEDTGADERTKYDARTLAENLVTQRTGMVDIATVALGDDTNTTIAELQTRLRLADKAVAECQQAATNLADTPAREEDARRKSEAAQTALTAAQEVATEAARASQNATTRYNDARQSIPDDLATREALDAARTHADRTVTTLRTAHENAISTEREAERIEIAAKEAVRGAEATDHTRAGDLAEAKNAFDRAIREAGFATDVEWRAALRPTEEITFHEREIAAYDEAFAIARDRKQRAIGAATGLTAPDLEALTAAVATTSNARDLAIEVAIRAEGHAERMGQAILDVVAIEQALGPRRTRLERHQHLAKQATGKGAYKVSFQGYVLAQVFNEVLVAASHRLEKVSQGRYTMQRRETTIDRRKNAGLDIEMVDSYTGQAREVTTLSGGESFQASLSLAFGLADVVQRHVGGVRLDCIFVDEGFGSLDPEALDHAIGMLKDLQSGGRLVGIISHVGDLRQHIDARLTLTKTPTGSTAKFNV